MKTLVELVRKPNRNVSLSWSVTAKRYCAARASSQLKKKERKAPETDVKKGTSSLLFESEECAHMAKVLKFQKMKTDIVQNSEQDSNLSSEKPRKNELNVQMLSGNLHKQIFGNSPKVELDPEQLQKSINDLKLHGLWKDDIDFLQDVNIKIPPLKGKDIEEHFYLLGVEQSEVYKNLALKFIKGELPKLPDVWLFQKGWTKYVEGQEPISVPYPDSEIIVIDVEVCVKVSHLPVLATAASNSAWYGWVSSDLVSGIEAPPNSFYNTYNLMHFDDASYSNKYVPRLVIGHNVSYDRARMREPYSLKDSALRFMDTMSLHVCIGGISKNQKAALKKTLDDEGMQSWRAYSCLSSLKDVYQLYCQKNLEKEKRSIFVEGSLANVKDDFQSLMQYCSNDVVATFEVFKEIFPTFLQRFPHPVTLAGMLEMGNAYMPVTENWKKFLMEADQTYDDLRNEMSATLSKKCNTACRLFHNEAYKNDLWMWNEDWSTQEFKLTKKKAPAKKLSENEVKEVLDKEEVVEDEEKTLENKFQYLFDLEHVLPKIKPFLPGYPNWYRKLCEKTDTIVQPTTSMIVTPKLLHLTWENYPLHYIREFGWGILVADINATNVKTDLPFEKLKNVTLRNCELKYDYEPNPNFSIPALRKKSKGLRPPSYYGGGGIWNGHTVDDCCYFFKLPHKNGPDKNVGNPLSKDFSQIFSSNFLGASDDSAEKVIDLAMKLSYWRNNRERLMEQMVVWLNKKEYSTHAAEDDSSPVGVILPKVVVSGTLTRRALEATWLTASRVAENRIGSELRSLIEAPPGYHIVGADVDSQELWIASVIGDSNAGKIHGSTPLGWMTVSGSKASETDMHSMTAKAVGISRAHAKILNYARIYGAGERFATKLLQQFNPSMGDKEALSKARKMYALTKGKRYYAVKSSVKDEFVKKFGLLNVYDLASCYKMSSFLGKSFDEVFEASQWVGGTESAMFNRLEEVAKSQNPVTPFLSSRLSRALEPMYEGDDYHKTTRINWVVQSGAVDFLHLMLVCMRWLTNGQARYCFSFHDEIRYLVPTEKRYAAALAVHITNLLVRAFCSHRLGIYDLPQSVAFFSSVEVDKILRKEANDDCITPSNPHEMSKATKRKHVHREALEEVLNAPGENQQIVRVLGSRGNNLHEVQAPDSSTFLVSMPNKFRKNIWIKKGDYIVVEPIEEGEKVKAEMVKVILPDQIKYLKKENAWPPEFSDSNKKDDDELEDELFANCNQNVESDSNSVSSSSEDSD